MFPTMADCKLWTWSHWRQEAERRKGAHNRLCGPHQHTTSVTECLRNIQVGCQCLKIRLSNQNLNVWFLFEKWEIWVFWVHIPPSQPLTEEELWMLPLGSPLVPPHLGQVSPATCHCAWLLPCLLASLLRFLLSLWDIRTKWSHPLPSSDIS